MIKIAVGGAAGKMGNLISSLVEADENLCLVAKITRPQPDKLQADNSRAQPLPSVLADLNLPIDVFIDFSVIDALIPHLMIANERGYKMVIGVTGLQPKQQQALLEASKRIPIVYSPNMSIGVNVAYKALSLVTEALKGRADIAITEFHHKHKKDAPSGTALRMKAIVEETLAKTQTKNSPKAAGEAGADSRKEEMPKVEVASLRVGDIMGEHQVLFALGKEQLEIRHRAESREIFAKGALLAAKWLLDKPPGLYDMQDVLGLK